MIARWAPDGQKDKPLVGLHPVRRYGFTVVPMADVWDEWVPQECTLPTVERPLRQQEFDDVFSTVLLGRERVSPRVLRWVFDPSAEVTLRDLTARESACCTFFDFHLADGDAGLVVDVTVPSSQIAVLDALETRSAAGLRQ
ncbi:hypothetical protein GCM10022204_43790 [Microlunatus aurantiacus]|uniref:Uncharacterized protein n=2 Tax=Microlunatus aurantiacus TaxID=446786 RepID=A0ABP7EGG1_9ACTN